MAKTIIRPALFLTVISTVPPSILGYVSFAYFPNTPIWFGIVPIVVFVAVFVLYMRKVLREISTYETLTFESKIWGRIGVGLTLVFTIIGTLLAAQVVYSQTMTRTSCYDPANVNVTSPNCKVIQTVGVPQPGTVFVQQIIVGLIFGVLVFGIWTFYLSRLQKIKGS